MHHIKYTGNPWEALDEDLICLCEECHNKVHDENCHELTNDICRKLIENFNIDCIAYDNILSDLKNHIKLRQTYIIKDLNKLFKQLSVKYNYSKFFTMRDFKNYFGWEDYCNKKLKIITINEPWL